MRGLMLVKVLLAPAEIKMKKAKRQKVKKLLKERKERKQ
jgi:hypothetical protein